MRYLALACDYDGTLASGGTVSEATLAALEAVLASGRKLILVTGRELDDLKSVFPHLNLFERVVAENGALLFRPSDGEQRLLGQAPPGELIQRLIEQEIQPSLGRVIVATWQPHGPAVLTAIEDLGLDYQVIFNKGAVMVLPAGINKATGLAAALAELDLSSHNVVGIGDAENDMAFLRMCECSVAVANALPALKKEADITTAGDHGAGVEELIRAILDNDLRQFNAQLRRHEILLGRAGEREILLQPYGGSVMIAGPSGSGKSSLASGFLERLAERGYQFCIVDPEGDYEGFAGAVTLGDADHPPGVDEIRQLLRNPAQQAVINLLGIKLADRPAFFRDLLQNIHELRARTGHPHWLVVDEAHHLLPVSREAESLALPESLKTMLFITVHPDHVNPAILSSVELLMAVGDEPEAVFQGFCRVLGQSSPQGVPAALESGEALAWFRRNGGNLERFRFEPTRAERRRHRRKYAEGELGPDKSFFFRGPEGKLNLRCSNLMTFLDVANGVDEETWFFHLRRGDYSCWIRSSIKDASLADEVAGIEQRNDLSAPEGRELLCKAVQERYTAPV